jgi:hypothetical protein
MAGLGLLSGLASSAAILVPPNGFVWAPGAIFGVAVGAALTPRSPSRWVRVAAAGVVGTASYFAAYVTQEYGQATWPFPLAMTGAGFVGSLLVASGLAAVLGLVPDCSASPGWSAWARSPAASSG